MNFVSLTCRMCGDKSNVCVGKMWSFWHIERHLTCSNSLNLSKDSGHKSPQLDYYNAMFPGLPRCDLDRLQSIQNAAVRLIAGARQFGHVTPLLQARHWLPIEQRIVFKLGVMMYKTVNGMAPSYLRKYVISPASSRSSPCLRSAETDQLYVPRTRTVRGGRTFAVAGPRTWNSLPAVVRSAPSLPTFKKHLKTYLFRCAYDTAWRILFVLFHLFYFILFF